MAWQFIVALVLVIPIILFPVIFVWYINIGGIIQAFRQRQKAKATQKELAPEQTKW